MKIDLIIFNRGKNNVIYAGLWKATQMAHSRTLDECQFERRLVSGHSLPTATVPYFPPPHARDAWGSAQIFPPVLTCLHNPSPVVILKNTIQRPSNLIKI